VPLPALVREHPLVEQILADHRDRARGDDVAWAGYTGHVYRVLNFARALAPDTPERDDKLAIAGAFHDLEAFGSLDYLGPSIRAQDAWLRETGRSAWSDELALVIAERQLLHEGRSARARQADRDASVGPDAASARAPRAGAGRP
jgi:hypothetical protein